jgi:ATP-binding cassette subfamily F protein 3
VQSRIKMLDKVVPIEVPPERKKIHFQFPACAKSGRMALEIKHARKAYGDLLVFGDLSLHVERGDRIALVGPNGAGKSTLMRLLSSEDAPDTGQRIEGHNVVLEYFAQDEATRMDPSATVYETLASGSPNDMVPAIRNILGGFLFSGDDIHKRVRVLSGGERTRLAVARMLLRPSNVLLLDEPTNHLDLDSKDVLLDALVDYGGTLVFVSHDRYFVERLATKIIEVGHGRATLFPGNYKEFLWHKAQWSGAANQTARQPTTKAQPAAKARPPKPRNPPGPRAMRKSVQTSKHAESQADQARRRASTRSKRESPDAEQSLKALEQEMSAPGFYDNRDAAQAAAARHQALMWEVGDLMHQWEELQTPPTRLNALSLP